MLVNLPRPLARDDELTLDGHLRGPARRRHARARSDRAAAGQSRCQRGVRAHRRAAHASTPTAATGIRSRRSPTTPPASLRLTVPDDQACVATGAPANGNPVRVDSASRARPAPALRLRVDRAGALSRGDASRRGRECAAATRRSRAHRRDAGRSALRPDAGAPMPSPPSCRRRPRWRSRSWATRARRARPLVQAQAAAILVGLRATSLGDSPVSELHPGARRRSAAGRAQPGLFRAAAPAAADHATITWRERSGELRQASRSSSSRTSSRTSSGATRSAGENYHEQWISEGFAQYFALLYAERSRSRDAFEDILRQLRRDRRSPTSATARSGSAIASATCRATAASSARWSTTRARWCCTCCGG